MLKEITEPVIDQFKAINQNFSVQQKLITILVEQKIQKFANIASDLNFIQKNIVEHLSFNILFPSKS